MYIWKEIRALTGFNDKMIDYRNSMVREINFVFSKRYSEVEKNPVIVKEFELLKKRRIINGEKIGDPLQQTTVEASMLKELLKHSGDFISGLLLKKYYGLTTDNHGRDIYYEMSQTSSVYKNLIQNKSFISAFGFIQFFPKNEALAELEDIFKKAVNLKDNKSIIMIIEEMKKPQYYKITKDADIKQLLYDEAERAELEKRIEEARIIADLLGDNELNIRLNIVEALQNNEFDRAIENLKNLSDKQKIRKVILEYYNSEIKKGDIESLERAFNLAYYGGFTTEEDIKFLEKPAGKIIEHYIFSTKLGEKDYSEIGRYIEFAKKSYVFDIFSEKFLSMVELNQTEEAKQIKMRFGLVFIKGSYANEKKVLKKFNSLTETIGVHAIPKGEENLKAALDMVKIFDFKQKEIDHINSLFCKYYIVHRRYSEAKKYFVPGNNEVIELIDDELLKQITIKNYSSAYQFKKEFNLKFPKKVINNKKREIIDAIKDKEISIDNIAKNIIIDDIFESEAVSGQYYQRIIDYIEVDELNGSQTLIDLKIPIIQKSDSSLKVMISHVIEKLSPNSPNTAFKISKTFESILPPNVFDYIIHYIKKFLGI